VAVIGRQADTLVAKDWAGHEVLDLRANEWSIAKTDQWVQSVVSRRMDVYVGSNPTWGNLWDATNARSAVFGRELQQFTNAGYTGDGWTSAPPGRSRAVFDPSDPVQKRFVGYGPARLPDPRDGEVESLINTLVGGGTSRRSPGVEQRDHTGPFAVCDLAQQGQ
jgi:hypothetical protein